MNAYINAGDAALILWDAAFKGLVVLALAGLATLLLRKTSAATRHLVWCAAVGGVLVLPVLSLLLPAWRVPWMPDWKRALAPAAITIAAPPVEPIRAIHIAQNAARPAPGDAVVETPPPVDPTAAFPVAPSTPPVPPTGGEIEVTSQPSTFASLISGARISWIVWLWLCGALLGMLPLLIGLQRVGWLTRQARQIEEPEWQELLRELCGRLRVRSRVRLLRSDRVEMPMTWGAWRPVLLLPDTADNWPPERRRVVLLHELAHIKRLDWLTQTLAYIAGALHWFNPLIWLAARRMRVEREQACDDLVLRCGARASDYAAELLHLATHARAPGLVNFAAVPMARRSSLETRLRAILDGRRNRASLTRLAVAAALALLALVVVPVAMLRAGSDVKAQNTKANPSASTNAPWGKPVQGVKVRLRLAEAKPTNQIPRLLVDLVNEGAGQFTATTDPLCWQLQIDGNWYVPDDFARNRHLEFHLRSAVKAGEPWSAIPLDVNDTWRRAGADEIAHTRLNENVYNGTFNQVEFMRLLVFQPMRQFNLGPAAGVPEPVHLQLAPGKHIVRLTLVGESGSNAPLVRVVSNPVVIEVPTNAPAGAMNTNTNAAHYAAGFVPEHTEFMVGEPIYLAFNLTNTGNRILLLDILSGQWGLMGPFRIQILDAKGESLPDEYSQMIAQMRLAGTYPSPGGTGGGSKAIEPGHIFTDRLYLPTFAKFEKPGEYTVIATRNVSSYEVPVNSIDLASRGLLPSGDGMNWADLLDVGSVHMNVGPRELITNRFKLTVLPADPERLLGRERELLARLDGIGAKELAANRNTPRSLEIRGEWNAEKLAWWTGPDNQELGWIVLKLSELGDKRIIPGLEHHLADPSMKIRFACVKVLCALGEPLRPEWIIPIIKSRSWSVFDDPETFARQHGGTNAASILIDCLDMSDPSVSDLWNIRLLNTINEIGISGLDAPRNHDEKSESTPRQLSENAATIKRLRDWLNAHPLPPVQDASVESEGGRVMASAATTNSVHYAAGFVPEKTEIALGEPVYVDFHLTNSGNQKLWLQVGGHFFGRDEWFKLRAVDAEGRMAPDAHGSMIFGGGGVEGLQAIEPGGVYSAKLNFPDWIKFEKPGEYSVSVSRLIQLYTNQNFFSRSTNCVVDESFTNVFKVTVHAPFSDWGEPTNGLRTRLVADKYQYRAGEPVNLKIEVENIGEHAMRFQRPAAPYDDSLMVWDEKGRAVPFIGGPTQVLRMGGRDLAPGQTQRLDAFDLTAWYYLRRPGRYTIQLSGEQSLHAYLRLNYDGDGIPSSGKLAFEVVADAGAVADGDPVGCLLPVLPKRWSLANDGGKMGVVRPGSNREEAFGRKVRLNYYPPAPAVWEDRGEILLWTTEQPAAERAVPSGDTMPPSEYLGQAGRFHVYVSIDANAQKGWPTAKADILKALQDGPRGTIANEIEDPATLRERVERLIKDAPVGRRDVVWEPRPGATNQYRLRAGGIRLPLWDKRLGLELPIGQVFHSAADNRFYIQHETVAGNPLSFYGPFDGDPVTVLGLPALSERPVNEFDKAWLSAAQAGNPILKTENADLGWGEAVEGVSVRLQADKRVWAADDIPVLYAEVRNHSQNRTVIHPGTQVLGKLEVDGLSYSWPGGIDVFSANLPPGTQSAKPVLVRLDSKQWSGVTDRHPLRLAPGKHSVRFKMDFDQQFGASFSQPVEIEILEQTTSKTASNDHGAVQAPSAKPAANASQSLMASTAAGALAKEGSPLKPGALFIRYDIPGDATNAQVTFRLRPGGAQVPGSRGMEYYLEPKITNGGELLLTNLTPGTYEFFRSRALSSFGGSASYDRRTILIDSGQTQRVDMVRTTGRRVSGHIAGLDAINVRIACIYVLPGTLDGEPLISSSFQLPICDVLTFPGYFGKTGDFQTALLEPGDYTFMIEVYEPLRAEAAWKTGRPEPAFTGKATVRVMAGAAPPPVKIELRPRVAARIPKSPETMLAEIRGILPEDWTGELAKEPGVMDYALAGMKTVMTDLVQDSLFCINLTNLNISFNNNFSFNTGLLPPPHPCLRLYFLPAADPARFNLNDSNSPTPIVFLVGETTDYTVVTSGYDINASKGGPLMDRSIAPLGRALEKYFGRFSDKQTTDRLGMAADAAGGLLTDAGFAGQVVDDQTGKPIKEFHLEFSANDPKVPGSDVVLEPKFSPVYFGGRFGSQFKSSGSEWVEFWQSGESSSSYRIGWVTGQKIWPRIRADGYRPEPVTPEPVVWPVKLTNLVVRLKRQP